MENDNDEASSRCITEGVGLRVGVVALRVVALRVVAPQVVALRVVALGPAVQGRDGGRGMITGAR